ncbi:hypothetical protein [Saccharothrix deserti]|uniref:hypothetical protein n=1 Tax=Saccharothrix deserti TaxID=2593674 RepID=UPI00131B18AC|nr:hypothetical protein [Saccharothrix deserti]
MRLPRFRVLTWLTRPKTRGCPACGRSVKRDTTVCTGCGYNFALAEAHDMRAHHFPTNPGIKP